MMQATRGPLLLPQADGTVVYHGDGLLVGDGTGKALYVGDALGAPDAWRAIAVDALGVMMPPLLDVHTHIPQHPIRGHFVEGVENDAPQGKLLAGLLRNVFPAEVKCADAAYAKQVVDAFAADTLSHGVVGGATYMTTSPVATRVALERLPETWSVGLVLMDQQCPADIHTATDQLEGAVTELAQDFGRRLIVTDRFAVAVSTPLRQLASRLAERFDLRTQTHLNEQVAEKAFVESTLYPNHASYTDVYHQDGLLGHDCIVAHCIQMTDAEWDLLVEAGASVAHCPTSNLLLGSGVMPLDDVIERGLPYAIATDVGASPTVSMLAEMRRFMLVHRDQTDRATACEALVRSTVAAAGVLQWPASQATLAEGHPMSFIEVTSHAGCGEVDPEATAEQTMLDLLPPDPDHPGDTVMRVTLNGQVVYRRGGGRA